MLQIRQQPLSCHPQWLANNWTVQNLMQEIIFFNELIVFEFFLRNNFTSFRYSFVHVKCFSLWNCFIFKFWLDIWRLMTFWEKKRLNKINRLFVIFYQIWCFAPFSTFGWHILNEFGFNDLDLLNLNKTTNYKYCTNWLFCIR